MGPAHSTVVNHTKNTICVITFNNSDIIYRNYHNLYLIEAGQSLLVEANPDPVGLKVGVLYAINPDKQEFLYHRFLCKNDGTLNITDIKDQEISFYASRDDAVLQAKGKLRETETIPYNMACEVVTKLPSQLPPGVSPPVSATTRITNVAKSIASNVTSTINTAQAFIDKPSEKQNESNKIPPPDLSQPKEGAKQKQISTTINQNKKMSPPDLSQPKDTPKLNLTSANQTKKVGPPDLSQPKITSSQNQNDPTKNWENELKRIKEEARAAALAEIEAKMAKQKLEQEALDLEKSRQLPKNNENYSNNISNSTISDKYTNFPKPSGNLNVNNAETASNTSVTSVSSSTVSDNNNFTSNNNINNNNNNSNNNSNISNNINDTTYNNSTPINTSGVLIPEPRIKKKTTFADDTIDKSNINNVPKAEPVHNESKAEDSMEVPQVKTGCGVRCTIM